MCTKFSEFNKLQKKKITNYRINIGHNIRLYPDDYTSITKGATTIDLVPEYNPDPVIIASNRKLNTPIIVCATAGNVSLSDYSKTRT